MSNILEVRWGTSRGRDTYGYTLCSLWVDGRRVARCNGGGYDMKGTVIGSFIAGAYADRLRSLPLDAFPAERHWRASESPRCYCQDCYIKGCDADNYEPTYFPHGTEKCPKCGSEEILRDREDGKWIDDGRRLYGLTFHDPNYDPSKALVGVGCDDRTIGGGASGMTVGEAEAAGKSIGLERYQAVYRASSPVPTATHTHPSIDGACGLSSVERIMKAIGLSLRFISERSKVTAYELIDER